MSAPTPPRRPRSAETAILDATERILRERAFTELAVNDIIAAAGVSRTSFYAHFSSRTAVLAACLRRVVDELAAPPSEGVVAVDPFLTATGLDPAAAIRSSLVRWVALASDHGALLRTVSEEWIHDPELGELWLELMAGVSAATAGVITRARAAGTAPPGADPDALATCLMWGCEQVLHVTLVGGALGLDDPQAIVEPLAQLMLGGVFGAPGEG
jgi:AcrR family transcriptional regulator